MKKTIRNSVFETNSSSVHTLSYPKGECKTTYDQIADENGVIEVECGEFIGGVVHGLVEKLEYLCSYIALTSEREYAEPKEGKGHVLSSEDSWQMREILDALQMDFPNATELRAVHIENAFFDHQTAPYESSCIIDLYNSNEINNFLFNDDITIIMGRD